MTRLRITILVIAIFFILALPVNLSNSQSIFKCDIDRELYPSTPPLKGDDVIELQARLKELGFYAGPVDGIYGPGTIDAVRKLQELKGLPVDGIFRPETWLILAPPEEQMVMTKNPPPEGDLLIVIDVNTRTLTVYANGKPYKQYPVAVGKSSTATPLGDWKIIDKGGNWGSGFGTRWLGLNVPWGIYGIHGTNKPWSIGKMASHGCIRMFNRDVEELYEWVKVGTPVKITGKLPYLSFRRIMQKGSIGQDVVILQTRLRYFGFDPGDADGRYGPATENAIKELKMYYGLPVDGLATSNVYYLLALR